MFPHRGNVTVHSCRNGETGGLTWGERGREREEKGKREREGGERGEEKEEGEGDSKEPRYAFG